MHTYISVELLKKKHGLFSSSFVNIKLLGAKMIVTEKEK